MKERESLSTEPYKGVRDFYPSDWRRMQGLFDGVRAVLTRRGYEEYQASPMERAELYESKGNEEIVSEQTYTFTDRGDRRVTLRPEMTPTLARMVAGKRRELPSPFRWFSIGNRFRYERPQKGRLREFYQCDIDLVGLPEGEADIEIVSTASAILTAFGAKDSDFSIRINSRALLLAACNACGLTDEESMREYWRLLDRKAKMSKEDFEAARAGKEDPLGLIAANDPRILPEKERIMAIISALNERGITNAVFDAEIVRGFDYYTGMIFEIFDTDPENSRSLFGGGRYDGLVSLFGGDPIPAVGFALGDVTFLDFLDTHGYAISTGNQADIYIGTPRPDDRKAAQQFADELRAQAVRVFVNLTEKPLGDQIKDADRRSIPYFIAYGVDEAAAGQVRVKTLRTGSESSLRKQEVSAHVSRG